MLADGEDTILELANEGGDTLYATFTATLPANLEKLCLTTSGSVDGTGNALDNALTGGSGVNLLTGLAGNDSPGWRWKRRSLGRRTGNEPMSSITRVTSSSS